MIVAALLVRNEADRDLRSVLAHLNSLVDTIVVLDDGSTDDTVAVCEAAGAEVHKRGGAGWWRADGCEAHARQQLWQIATTAAGPHGWVLVCDADMVLGGLSAADLAALTQSTQVNAWSWVLYDAWNADATRHRVDGYWQASTVARPWLFKAMPSDGFRPQWGNRDIHVGHAPANYPLVSGIVPPPAGWVHLAYTTPERRARKLQQYLAKCDAA